MTTKGFARSRLFHLLLVALACGGTPARAATLPTGFSESVIASGLESPTAMQFAPDGRLFVCEQRGRLRVIKNGALLSTPFLTLTVSSSGERGLLGVAFDPAFSTNQFIYLYYTATTPTIHNRISRFTANGDTVVPGSEVVIFELDNLSSATNHNGGALAFGPDGKLYAAVGENANAANAQSMNNVLGKMLRLNADGSIPTDNPFYSSAVGRNRAIWALGLRNPFTFAFNPGGTELFINDVGQSTWEEINDGRVGANYGWPETEGPTTDPRYVGPRLAYRHTDGCAITGGSFYSPLTSQFPADYAGDYFFADYCGGWIRRLDRSAGSSAAGFATGIASPVDLKVADDGSLYYLARGSGTAAGVVFRITYGASAPTITMHPSSRTVQPGASVTFSVRASGPTPLRYQWQRNGVDIAGATGQDLTLASVALSDSGARFRARVTNDFGNVLSNEAVLTVNANRPPVGTITQPAAGAFYSGGNTIAYAGTGTDPDDGTLPASAFTWRVDFHHDAHVHPFIAPTSGARSGSFTIPTTGHTETNVWYRIYLTVTDSGGLTHTTERDIVPRIVRLTLATNPAGLEVKLDGQPFPSPLSFDSVVGVVRSIEATTPQASGGTTYELVSWSDGGAARHDVSTPGAATTYTATFRAGTGGPVHGLSGTYFNNANFTGTTVTRVDPTVDFSWGYGAPAPGISPNTYSVVWTGQVEAPVTGTYRFYTVSNDGVRLWVNGVRLVNNWTNHGNTENSGTIGLTAGQRYDIRMEYYQDLSTATARLLWSAPSIAKAVVPSARLYAQGSAGPNPATIRINFQTASASVPAGYLVDAGRTFADRGNGQTYGWNADRTTHTRDRNAAISPDQRYDTLVYMQRSPNPDGFWEIAVPNGSYAVRVVVGDPIYYDNPVRITAEGAVVLSGTTTSAARWIDTTATVAVTDGRLTIGNGAGANGNKICFVEITPQ
jgi:glucose/arabinose dehydrogenase